MAFIPARGMRYHQFLDRLHADCQFDWYLEIGCSQGRSLAPSRSPSIVVDPAFRVGGDIIGAKPCLHAFQQTSDDFFASGFLARNAIRPAFSFLDGMHLFEFLLRDFIHAEAAGTRSSVIALHDCCPSRHDMTGRDRTKGPPGAWAGDVWKLIPILLDHRPDLCLDVLDCMPTGLVIVSGLDPASTVLRDRYDQIVGQYRQMTLADFGASRFFGLFTFRDAQAEVQAGFPLFASCRQAQGRARP